MFGNEQNNSTHLFALASTHDCRLCTLIIDVSPKILGSRLRRGLGLLNGLVDDLLGGLIDALKRALAC
jgi:hypothetical protein